MRQQPARISNNAVEIIEHQRLFVAFLYICPHFFIYHNKTNHENISHFTLLAALSLSTAWLRRYRSRKYQEETAAKQRAERLAAKRNPARQVADKARAEAETQITTLQKQIGELQIKI